MKAGKQDALAAIAKVRFRLNSETRAIVDRLLRGEKPRDDDAMTVENACNEVWSASGRRSTTTKRLAAHEAVERYLRRCFQAAIYSAEFALPYCRHGRATSTRASIPGGAK